MSTGLGLALLAVLIALNGLFVAAEFSLVAVRRGVIEERAAAGERRARTVLAELRDLSFVLSAAQFGITASSLLLGFVAEDAMRPLVDPVTGALGLPEASATAVAVAVALLSSTVVQMLFGELAPKNLAIARPEAVSLALGAPMRLFQVLFGPIIRVFDWSAEWVSTRFFGIEATDELLEAHSLEELSRIIVASGDEGSLSPEQAELLGRAVELGDRRVGTVMVPRTDVVWLHAADDLETLRVAARRTGHSRFPVSGDSDDEVVGTLHIKEMLRVPAAERDRVTCGQLSSAPMLVPESDSLRRLLSRFRASRRTFAVVVDEYGGTAGIVTVEDLVEELVGEIEDEFDRRPRDIRPSGPGRWVVAGTLRVGDVSQRLGLELPPGDYETVAGFVIDRLGRIPEEGDRVRHGGWVLVVTRMDDVRVAELRLQAPRGDAT